MVTTVARFAEPGHSVKELVETLQRRGQDPRVYRDANPDTGEMITVRGEIPLEGTRYFHAQYFTNDSGERFVQHMSFEIKPSPQAMTAAVDAVTRLFPNLTTPTHRRDGYMRWKLGDDQILWIKRLTADDLSHDPVNAYTPADVGAVRVALEHDIHPD